MAVFDITSDTYLSSMSPKPTSGDTIYVAEGATFYIDEDLACKQIRLGELSTGAATAGKRYGILSCDGNPHTITFDGAYDLGSTGSGIYVSPASADSSSKQCKVYLRNITVQSSVSGYDINYRVGNYLYYGDWDVAYCEFKYYAEYGLYFYAADDRHSSNTVNFHHCTFWKDRHGYVLYIAGSTSYTQQFYFNLSHSLVKGDYTDGNNITFVNDASGVPLSTIDVSGNKFEDISTTGWTRISWIITLSDGTDGNAELYTGTVLHSSDYDIRTTEVIPSNFSVSVPNISGCLDVSWDNAASYRSIANGDLVQDFVYVYDNATGNILGIFDATAGSGRISGLTNDTEYTLYAKATTDGIHFSDASNTASGTPQAGAPPTFTGTISASRTAGQNAITIDLSGATISGADHIRVYVKAGSAPDTSVETDLAMIARPTDTQVIVRNDGSYNRLQGGQTYYIKLVAVSSSGAKTEHPTTLTVQPYGYMSLT